MGTVKKTARLKADMANDLMLCEINEHRMTVEIRKLRELVARRARQVIAAALLGSAAGFAACYILDHGNAIVAAFGAACSAVCAGAAHVHG